MCVCIILWHVVKVWKVGAHDWDLGKDFCRRGAEYSFLSVCLVAFFSPAKMLAWSRASSQFHSLDLAAIFLGAVVLAGVWVSLLLSKNHATVFSLCWIWAGKAMFAWLWLGPCSSALKFKGRSLVRMDVPARHKALAEFHISSAFRSHGGVNSCGRKPPHPHSDSCHHRHCPPDGPDRFPYRKVSAIPSAQWLHFPQEEGECPQLGDAQADEESTAHAS